MLTGIANGVITTQGKVQKYRCQFIRDTPITTELIQANIALFNNGSLLPSSYVFKKDYTTGDFIYTGPTNQELQSAKLEVLDDYNFVVCIEAIVISDNGNYLGNYTHNNSTAFTPSSYGSLASIAVNVGTDNAICDIPVNVSGFNTDVTFNIDYGSNPSNPIEVELCSTFGLGSSYYVGLYREDAVNTVNVEDGTGLHYAFVNGGVSQVNDIPTSCIVGASNFTYSTKSTATVEIDRSCLVEGVCYRLFTVHTKGGQCYSSRSQKIIGGQINRPCIEGNIIGTIEDNLGNTFSTCCVKGANECVDYTFCAELDKASYNSNLATEGITGTIDDYFTGATAFFLNSLPTNASQINGGLGLPINVVNDTSSIKACATLQNGSGQRYLALCFGFDFGGSEDNLYKVFEICYGQNATTPIQCDTVQIDIVVDDTEPDDYQVAINVIDPNCILVGEFDGMIQTGTNLTFDVPKNYTPPITSTPQVVGISLDLSCSNGCTLENIIIPYSQIVSLSDTQQYVDSLFVTPTSGSQPQTPITPNITGLTNSIICREDMSTITVNTGVTGCSALVSENGGKFQQNAAFTGNLSVNTALLSEGSEYCVKLVCVDGQSSDPIDSTDIECNGSGWFNFECDEETGAISGVSEANDFNPAPTTITSQESTDGLTYGALGGSYQDKVWLRTTYEFEDCPNIVVNEIVECNTIANCINSRDIECEVLNGVATLTVTDSFDSTPLLDTLEYSLDGINYQPYTAPVTTSVIYYKSQVIFEDNCPDINISGDCNEETTVDPTDCDYVGYTLDCVEDEENCEFTITYTGDTSVLVDPYPRFSLDGSNPTDNGIQVTSSPMTFGGQGTLIVTWELEKEGCPKELLSKVCFIKPQESIELPECFQVEVKNFDDIGVIDVNVVNECLVVEVKGCVTICDDPCLCEDLGPLTITIDCEPPLLTAVINTDGLECELEPISQGWYKDNILVGTGLDFTVVDAGLYTYKMIFDGCEKISNELSITFPEAGEPNPIAGK